MLWRFNRTFMELKCPKLISKILEIIVLIVPLWNWNIVSTELELVKGSFNRTFMELKFKERLAKLHKKGSFNRTFMELK